MVLLQHSSVAEPTVKRRLGKDELQALWRSAIDQTILLNRMEKENNNLLGEFPVRESNSATHIWSEGQPISCWARYICVWLLVTVAQ